MPTLIDELRDPAALLVAFIMAIIAAILVDEIVNETRSFWRWVARVVGNQCALLPFCVLRMARPLLPGHLRQHLYDEGWSRELQHILTQPDRHSFVRFCTGLRFACSLVWSAPIISLQYRVRPPRFVLLRTIFLLNGVLGLLSVFGMAIGLTLVIFAPPGSVVAEVFAEAAFFGCLAFYPVGWLLLVTMGLDVFDRVEGYQAGVVWAWREDIPVERLGVIVSVAQRTRSFYQGGQNKNQMMSVIQTQTVTMCEIKHKVTPAWTDGFTIGAERVLHARRRLQAA
jgi:hypothetical protein